MTLKVAHRLGFLIHLLYVNGYSIYLNTQGYNVFALCMFANIVLLWAYMETKDRYINNKPTNHE